MCTMWIGQCVYSVDSLCVYNVDRSVCVRCGYMCVYNVDRSVCVQFG